MDGAPAVEGGFHIWRAISWPGMGWNQQRDDLRRNLDAHRQIAQ
jgi:hypothetical protein